ncbi:MAG: dihydropteroate synthase [SAR324 cluster bacterium]|nr:dihydropteroate synthase [SAR324 cluster bacterium]
MGILNVTPDSFSDGGKYFQQDHAFQQGLSMCQDGTDCIDIGGESSGPGSLDVSETEETLRVLPVVEALRAQSDVWISVDTWKSGVARKTIEAGADMINDVTALRGDPHLVEVLVETGAPVVLMYSKDTSARTSTESKEYTDVMGTVKAFFEERILWAEKQGLRQEAIILDPGMGFFISGNPQYSFEILRRLDELVAWGFPVLIGPSRKSFLSRIRPGRVLNVQEREIPGLAAACTGLHQGASWIRMHHTAEARLLIDTFCSIHSKT